MRISEDLVGRRATIWIETEDYAYGYGPRAGEVVKISDRDLILHSIDYEHNLAFRINSNLEMDSLNDECEVEDLEVVSIEWWDKEYEVHIFHQDIPTISEPIIYGDDTVFAIGWNKRMNSNRYGQIIYDETNRRFRIERVSDGELPKFDKKSNTNSDYTLDKYVDTDIGYLDNPIHKISTENPLFENHLRFTQLNYS